MIYSIRDVKTKLVLGHASRILLSGCKFVVSEASRNRILQKQQRNICGWVEGNFGVLHAGDDEIFTNGFKVKFDPYENETFIFQDTGRCILSANLVYINEQGVFASGL